MRVIALIDGEHHPEVARDALDRVAAEHDLAAVLFVGGEEKVGRAVLDDPREYYGRDVELAPGGALEGLRALAGRTDPEAVLDLSGEPVLGGDERFALASVALHLGLAYETAGFTATPPRRERLDFDGPVLAVTGTGKRTGKTAVAGHFGSLLRGRGTDAVIVSMGRGGPSRPQLVRAAERPGLERLLEIARAGGHAASDYLEDAVLAGVACVGCRRCGEGLAGEVYDSNVLEGARLAASLSPDAILLEGSGAALPPVAAQRTVCVTSAARARSQALAYLGPYRLLCADLVVVVGAEALPAAELEELKRDLARWCDPNAIVACSLDPEPAGRLPRGARAAVFTTAHPEQEAELRARLENKGVDVCLFSFNLARRADLERDLASAAERGCDVFLTELKAAAIEVVAEEAARREVPLEFLAYRPVSLDGEPDLDSELETLFVEAEAQARSTTPAVESK